MQIIDRTIIYDASRQPLARRIAYFTSLCVLRSGAVLCVFQVGSSKNGPDSTLGMCRSTDGGATWQPIPLELATTLDGVPGSLAAGEIVETASGRLLLFAAWFDRSEPERPLFDPQTEGILHSRQVYAASDDGGESWSDWTRLSTPGLTGCATSGPVVAWSDGSFAYSFESFKEFDDPLPGRHASWLLCSRDGGRSFQKPACVASDPNGKVYYWDQRLCATANPGEFVAFFWTHDRAAQRDLNVHFRKATLSGETTAGGPVQPTSIPGQISAPLVVGANHWLVFVVDRHAPGTMKLWQTFDGGATWPEDQCLLVYTHQERAALTQGMTNIDFAEYWEDMGKWTFGHPAIRRLDQHQLLLGYYAGTPDCLSIHGVRVRLERE